MHFELDPEALLSHESAESLSVLCDLGYSVGLAGERKDSSARFVCA
jgi:hypothetical protein